MNDNAASFAGSHVGVTIADVFVQEVLAAMDFPLSMRIPETVSQDGEWPGLGTAETSVDNSGRTGSEDVVLSELGAALESVLIDVAKKVRDGTIDTSSASSDELAALKVLASVIGTGELQERGIFTSENGEIKKALDVLVTDKSVKVEVSWIELEVGRPALSFGNPIALSNMVCKVQAKIKACLHVLGRDFCASATSPQIRLEARRATLTLSGQGPRAVAIPKFQDLDIVVRIKIWKWTYDLRIGITSIVNAALRKQTPIVVMDMSMFEQKVPFSNKQIRIGAFAFPPDASGLAIQANLAIS